VYGSASVRNSVQASGSHSAIKLYRVAHSFCHISILVCKQYLSAVRHSVYRGCRKGGHSDTPSSLRPCRWRQQISPRRLYLRTELHGVIKPQQCTVNSSSFCCSLSRVRERTAAACEPLYPWRKGGGTGGLPAHGEWLGNPLLPDNIPVKVAGKLSVYVKCQ